MGTWKLSIKPDSQEGFDPFEVCKKNSLIGIGWSYIYENNNIKTKDEAYKVLSTEKSFPQPVRILLDDVSTGDYVWLHQQGSFFLCKVENDEAVLGPSITKELKINNTYTSGIIL